MKYICIFVYVCMGIHVRHIFYINRIIYAYNLYVKNHFKNLPALPPTSSRNYAFSLIVENSALSEI